MHSYKGLQRVCTLPNELHEAIITQADFSDLKALSCVSKTYREIALPILFKTLAITTRRHDFVVQGPRGDRIRFDLQLCRPLGFLRFVKCIRLDPSYYNYFGDIMSRGCSHTHQLDARSLMQIFGHLKRDSLNTFSWNPETCLPNEVFGINSYLATKQRSLQGLSLITDTTCDVAEEDQVDPAFLTRFQSLRNFSWKGVHHVSELKSVRNYLEANQHIIESLELDFVNWSRVAQLWVEQDGMLYKSLVENLFTASVLDIGLNDNYIILQSLCHLSLSSIELSKTRADLQIALNIENLSSLTLHNCTNTTGLLRSIVEQGLNLSLTFLELIIDDVKEENWQDSVLRVFLGSFSGLEYLHLLLRPLLAHTRYWEAIANHKSTLKSFVYHERNHWVWPAHLTYPDIWDIDLGEQPDWLLDDLGGLSYGSYDHQFLNGCFADSELENLAICDTPNRVRFKMQSTALPQSLKLLHLRSTAGDHFPNHVGPLGSNFRSEYTFNLEEWVREGQPISVNFRPGIDQDPFDTDEVLFDTSQGQFAGEDHPFDFDPFGSSYNAYDPYRDDEEAKENLRAKYDWYEVFAFAHWVFSREGLGNLQVLALGRFSFKGGFDKEHVLFSRSVSSGPRPNFKLMDLDDDPPPMRPFGLRKEELRHFEGIDRPFEFLAACPRVSLLGTLFGQEWP